MSFQARKKTVKRRREEKPPCDLGVLLSEYMSLRGREGEAVISQLLRASIGLQKAFDRRFAYAGLTAQEAAVLVHCAEANELSAGRLAQAMGRDKGIPAARQRPAGSAAAHHQIHCPGGTRGAPTEEDL